MPALLTPVRETRYRLKTVTWTVAREADVPSPRKLADAEAVAALAKDLARAVDDDREHFWVVSVACNNRYLGHTEVSTGTLNSSLAHPREVFRAAILGGAASVILIHNHPSGDPTPSKEDRDLTRRLAEGGRLLGIPILDHLIIGNGTEDWVSLAGRGDL